MLNKPPDVIDNMTGTEKQAALKKIANKAIEENIDVFKRLAEI